VPLRAQILTAPRIAAIGEGIPLIRADETRRGLRQSPKTHERIPYPDLAKRVIMAEISLRTLAGPGDTGVPSSRTCACRIRPTACRIARDPPSGLRPVQS